MNIVRQIEIFDNETNLLVEEVSLELFDLEIFKERFKAKNDDPLVYNPYEITTETVDLFPSMNFDFEKFSYFISCYKI